MSFENKELCKKCGGVCCKRMPACAVPQDFGEIRPGLLFALKSGNWAVDWLDKDTFEEPDGTERERAYFIRPAVKGAKSIFDNSKSGECVFLQENGCILLLEDRPIGCRLLEPKEDLNCILHFGSTKDSASMWLQYKDLIEEAAGEINDPSFHTDPDD